MQYLTGVWLAAIALSTTGCIDSNSVTSQQMENQDRADAVVSGVLFEHELDTTASYNVRKDGFVVIRFDESVPDQKYTDVVNLLRESAAINGVRAEQGGREVCPLRR